MTRTIKIGIQEGETVRAAIIRLLEAARLQNTFFTASWLAETLCCDDQSHVRRIIAAMNADGLLLTSQKSAHNNRYPDCYALAIPANKIGVKPTKNCAAWRFMQTRTAKNTAFTKKAVGFASGLSTASTQSFFKLLIQDGGLVMIQASKGMIPAGYIVSQSHVDRLCPKIIKSTSGKALKWP